ncbi:tRNA pseudouridine(55) synthase TruB [Anaerosinus massiliensis]|uniref:tRNA pseudouridine(55) synthase TruB n=1 Tax=Massilibacillus massiliensis TaxID=1806837 RepID=UPI000AD0B30C|nr:tRNA pseudouridine(55) synthase TruB [Massilibacillus massiliensis]
MYNGFINILKPPGMSSHDVVSFIRRTYGMKKVGHAGTLDPAAAGVLPIALGKATRLIEYLVDADKMYRAEVTFGYATDTGDITGNIVEELYDFEKPTLETINDVLKSFLGENHQLPPMYSAIKINGVKLYDLARKGMSIDRPTRKIFIKQINLIEHRTSSFLFDVQCSKGTYIRTLCFDIGVKLGLPSVMSFLIRTRVGDFQLENAFIIEEITKNPLQAIQTLDSVLSHMPRITLPINLAQKFIQGQKILLENTKNVNSFVRIYENTNNFIGIGEFDSYTSVLKPTKVMI